MAKLASIGPWRHAVVGAAALVGSGVGFAGEFQQLALTERFDAKTVIVVPDGPDGVRITEYVDQDFARSPDRHGYQRVIPTDFGVPIRIEASSPDAPADLSVSQVFADTRIRVGDPQITVSGQHRYVLSYTLPAAQLSRNELALDIIGNDETMETGRFEVIVAGMELSDPTCNVGSFGDVGRCDLQPTELTAADGSKIAAYRAVVEPLKPGQGITVGGTITSVSSPAAFTAPAIPERRPATRPDMGAAMLGLGSLSGAAAFLLSRRIGRNEVAGGGAADAAYSGETSAFPAPGGTPLATMAVPDGPRRLVTDAELARMATIEFVPPKGVSPWEGAVLLSETVSQQTVSAWFSGLSATGAVEMSTEESSGMFSSGRQTTMSIGPNAHALQGEDADILAEAFRGRSSVQLGTYDASFAAAWRRVMAMQRRHVAGGGLWRRFAPNPASIGLGLAPIVLGLGAVFGLLVVLGALFGIVGGWLVALGVALLVPAVLGFVLYRPMLPARTARGSALALRTESFRRFLAASEAKHVDWAWQHGLLREYSAWAVALGEAQAWNRAMHASSIVPAAELTHGPMVIWYAGPSINATRTAPPPTGGSGGGGGGGGFGGFSGGSVGGGGGGGSSGSW